MTKRALCIGINDYPGTDSDLAGCVNDANDWAAEMARRGFTVEKIFDRQATGKRMREAIQALMLEAKRGDSLVIQYSGHGSYVPDTNGDEPDAVDECLCPHDIAKNGPLVDDELHTLFSGAKKGVKIVMISDSCHSGSVARFAPITTPPTMRAAAAPRRTVRFLPPETFLSKRSPELRALARATVHPRAAKPHEALLLAGCQDNEYSYDAYFQGRPNGAFTFAALRSIAKLPAQGTYAAWFTEIRKILPSRQYPQSPKIEGASYMKRWKVMA